MANMWKKKIPQNSGFYWMLFLDKNKNPKITVAQVNIWEEDIISVSSTAGSWSFRKKTENKHRKQFNWQEVMFNHQVIALPECEKEIKKMKGKNVTNKNK